MIRPLAFFALLVTVSTTGCAFLLAASVCDSDDDCDGVCSSSGFCEEGELARDAGAAPMIDAGQRVDAGAPDAGSPSDAGQKPDAGVIDAGPVCLPAERVELLLRSGETGVVVLNCALAAAVDPGPNVSVNVATEQGQTVVQVLAGAPVANTTTFVRFGDGELSTQIDVKIFQADWFDFRFTHRVPVRTSTTVDVLVPRTPIHVTFTADDYPVSPQAAELRFAQGLAQVPAEVISWDSAAGGDVWLRVDVGPGASGVYLYLADEVPVDVVAPAATEVWEDYVAVWHVGERTRNSAAGPTGAFTGESDFDVGVFGAGINDNDNDSDRAAQLSFPAQPSFAELTFTGWGRRFGDVVPFYDWLAVTDCDALDVLQFSGRIDFNSGAPEFRVNALNRSERRLATSSAAFDPLALRVTGTSVLGRYNTTTVEFELDAPLNTGVEFFCLRLSADDYEGALDELRVAATAFSDERLMLEVESARADFVTVDVVQTPHE